MFHFIGASNTRNLINAEGNNLPVTRMTGIGGLSLNNPLDSKNLFKVLEKMGPKRYIVNHDVVNNSITDFNDIKGMDEKAFFASLGRLRQLGVVAVILHPREGAPLFPLEKEHKFHRHFITIKIKRALGSVWRHYYAQNPNVERIHIPIALEFRFTRQVLQCDNEEELQNINKIKHKHRRPGAGSRARHNWY